MSTSPANNSTDFFSWKGIVLQQNDKVLKVGTDAILLATWIPTLGIDPKNILDVGTGSGILSLLMAKSFQQVSIVAIDPDENAVQLARMNSENSSFEKRISVNQINLSAYTTSTAQKFDLIISNPPFYVNHIMPKLDSMQNAKHASSSPADWMSAMTRILNDHGRICLVLPTLVVFEWIREANHNQLFCNNRMDFFSFPRDKQSKRSLLCLSHALEKQDHSSMIMYTNEKNYTKEYATWLGV